MAAPAQTSANNPTDSVLAAVCSEDQACRLTRDLELTLHLLHTGRQCNVASIPLGLSIFDALDRPIGAAGGHRINAFDDNSDQTLALCIARANSLGQRRFERGPGDGRAFDFCSLRGFRAHLASRILGYLGRNRAVL